MNLQETDISIEINKKGLDSSNNLEVRKAIKLGKVAKLTINSGRALRTDDVSPSPQTPIPIVENMNNSFVPAFKSNGDNRIVKKDWHEETITAGN
jgi:hypothetical protein